MEYWSVDLEDKEEVVLNFRKAKPGPLGFDSLLKDLKFCKTLEGKGGQNGWLF